MVTVPVLPLTGFIFLNLFGLLECLVMWLISMPVIKVYLPNFSNRAIGIINFERLSPNFSRHYELVSKFNVGLKTLLHQGLSEPEFYGDLVYKFKKNVGRADFSDQKNYRSLQTYWI